MATLPETKTLALDGTRLVTVWFNQPERRNPLTDEAVEDLAASSIPSRTSAISVV